MNSETYAETGGAALPEVSERKSARRRHATFAAKLLISALILAPAYMFGILAAVVTLIASPKTFGYGFLGAFSACCLLFCPTTWLQFWSGYDFWSALGKTVTGYAIVAAFICIVRLLGL